MTDEHLRRLERHARRCPGDIDTARALAWTRLRVGVAVLRGAHSSSDPHVIAAFLRERVNLGLLRMPDLSTCAFLGAYAPRLALGLQEGQSSVPRSDDEVTLWLRALSRAGGRKPAIVATAIAAARLCTVGESREEVDAALRLAEAYVKSRTDRRLGCAAALAASRIRFKFVGPELVARSAALAAGASRPVGEHLHLAQHAIVTGWGVVRPRASLSVFVRLVCRTTLDGPLGEACMPDEALGGQVTRSAALGSDDCGDADETLSARVP